MPPGDKAQIYIQLWQLLKELHEVVRNLPKHHKYALGRSTLSLAWRCLDLTVEANFYRDRDLKKKKISELSLNFDKLKLRIRMMNELNLIISKKYQYLYLNYLKRIGEMIGGWGKWVYL